MNQNTLGYLAGVIDGEGYIGLEKTQRTKALKDQRWWSPRYQPNVCVINTNKDLIDFLQKEWSGSVTLRRGNQIKFHWKTCWRWRLNQGRIVEFLTLIRPFLIVKPKQADLLLRFYRERKLKLHHREHISEEELAFRESIYREIKRLNHYDPQRLNEEALIPKGKGDAIV